MGFLIHQLPSELAIRRAHFAAALAAVHGLHERATLTGVPGGLRVPFGNDRAFVDGRRVLECATLEEALGAWRWIAITDDGPDGMTDAVPGPRNIVGLEFIGEKLGDEDALFAALAPFVDEGSYVAVVGEDGRVWRWVFRGCRCYCQAGRLTYDEPLGEPVRLQGSDGGDLAD
jgi:hypothetical protein